MNNLDRERKDMQLVIGRMLQIGVLVSAFTLLLGAAVYLVRHGQDVSIVSNYGRFRGEEPQLKSVVPIARDAFSASSRAIMQLGLVLLIATPIARVVFSFITFIKERDRLYTVFTLVVLLLLSYSLFASK